MKWQFVYNSSLGLVGMYTRDKLAKFLKENTGYKFFTFNGLVYDLNSEETGITVDDLV